VISMSFAGYTDGDELPPLASILDELVADETVVVAAAGNAGSPRPAFPAAIPEVVAVGGLDTVGRAWFSNFGGWVDACAPAVDVLSTFLIGVKDAAYGVERDFTDGWATWSGTSFAAPKVAAAIADLMDHEDVSAPEAWRRLGDWRRSRHPDLGVIVNVL
jgi:subtilisin family serine protease